MFEKVNYHIILRIFDFLELSVIFGQLKESIPYINDILAVPEIKKQLLYKKCPHQFISQFQTIQQLDQLLEQFLTQKVQELPFWGIETNSGIAGNTLRFWIGKSFMRSRDPMVAVRMLTDQTYISGVLAHNQANFKKHLMGFYNKNIISEDQSRKMKDIEIIHVYQNLYMFGFAFANQHESIQYLQYYSQTMSNMLSQTIQQDQFHLKDNIHNKLDNNLAIINKIHINNYTDFNRTVNCFMIFTSDQAEYPQIQQKAPKDYHEFLKLDYQISRTNIVELQNCAQLVDFNTNAQFITFKPQVNGPILWVKLIQGDDFKITLKKKERPICRSVNLRLLDAKYEEMEEGYEGIGFQYVSLKGYLIDMNKIQL
ncbi:hypothetical protein pb186bvf_003861 [Paramecium bursaria]